VTGFSGKVKLIIISDFSAFSCFSQHLFIRTSGYLDVSGFHEFSTADLINDLATDKEPKSNIQDPDFNFQHRASSRFLA
jgi:hypothetical protein